MKRIASAALLILIAGTVQPAAATTVPICPPQWMAELLQGYIAFACTVEDEGAGGDEGIVRQARAMPGEITSGAVPIPYESRVVPEPRGEEDAYREAYREYSTEGRGLSANRPPRRTRESTEAP